MSHSAANFSTWSKSHQTRIEHVLEEVIPSGAITPETLHNAMRYSALNGGKRVRALLCYAAAELSGIEPRTADAAAAAIELIHAYSLVHDDLPCMDDDDLRRGKPSCHKQYDEATALLVGDALQSLAFAVLSSPLPNLDADQQLAMVNILAKASGSLGMAGGQAIDLCAVGKTLNKTELEAMHQRKTGALIQAAIALGAGGNQSLLPHLERYAQAIGLAFQVIDDILDAQADSSILGKTAGKDAFSNKPTYVTILGLETAQKLAEELHQSAIDAISPFGSEALRLRELADFIAQRNF